MKLKHLFLTFLLLLLLIPLQAVAQSALWDSYIQQGNRFYADKNYPEAERMLLAALEEGIQFKSSDSRLVLTLNKLGMIYKATRQYTKAEKVYRRALDIVESSSVYDELMVSNALKRLAEAYQFSGGGNQAEALMKRATEIQKKYPPLNADLVLPPETSSPQEAPATQGNLSNVTAPPTTPAPQEDVLAKLSPSKEKKSPKEVDFGPYLGKLHKKIRTNWTPPKLLEDKSAVARFTIARNGKVLEAHLKQPSGNVVFDRAALKAVNQAAPFAPLPKGYDKETIAVEFTFDYNAHYRNKNEYPNDSTATSLTTTSKGGPSYEIFRRNLDNQIQRHWPANLVLKDAKIVVLMKIDRKGNLLDAQLEDLSGNRDMDKAALDTINASVPFSPLPSTYPNAFINLEAVFLPSP